VRQAAGTAGRAPPGGFLHGRLLGRPGGGRRDGQPDRDTKYTLVFDGVLGAEDIQLIKTPPRAPRANAICERVVGTLRRELLDRILILGPGHLRRVLAEYAIHYNGHRPSQGLGQRSPDADPAIPAPITDLTGTRIKRRPILGGLINEYEAA
jgi:putative transposase